ncbi:MAG: FtsX-like permease family protein [Planctomycetota bacterium]
MGAIPEGFHRKAVRMTLVLALRNIFRNRARSLITLGAVAFGAVSLIQSGGFITDTVVQFRERFIRIQVGHLQMFAPRYYEEGVARPYDFLIPDPAAVIRDVRAVPGVHNAVPRLSFAGLIGNEETSVPFLGTGIDPAAEMEVRDDLYMFFGKNLEPGDDQEVILGKGLAEAIEAKVGDLLVITGHTAQDRTNYMEARVKGVFGSTSQEYDALGIRMPLKRVQTFLRTEGAHVVVVYLDRTADTDRIRGEVLRRPAVAGAGFNVKTWRELPEADFILKTGPFFESMFSVLKIIIGIIGVLCVFNTMNMAVLERVGEIGTMMALGTRRVRILALFLLEGLFIGIVGGLAGVAGGVVLAWGISLVGIRMPKPPGLNVHWIAHIAVVPGLLVFALGLSVVTAVVSSVIPAWKASRLETGEALRHNI